MTPQDTKYILTVSCPDVAGIVRALTNVLFEQGAAINDTGQFSDPETKEFFMRCEFQAVDGFLPSLLDMKQAFAEVCAEFNMKLSINDAHYKPKIVVAVSKFGHCLNDILHRWQTGILPVDIVGVVSNHEDMRDMAEWHKVPYYYLPVTKETKRTQEEQILQIMTDAKADLLALARYMQILSPEMCRDLSGRAINIHHSFLPSFKGARPYFQAYERGVKIIGATAHYVTTVLDEGPIIEQAVERIGHHFSASDLVRIGRDTECLAFSRAIKWHCEHRVVLNGHKTVVFN